MKKTTVLIILGVITVFCIIYGSVKHLGGGFKAMSEWSVENGVYEDSKDRTSFNQNLEAFSAIDNVNMVRLIDSENFNGVKAQVEINTGFTVTNPDCIVVKTTSGSV